MEIYKITSVAEIDPVHINMALLLAYHHVDNIIDEMESSFCYTNEQHALDTLESDWSSLLEDIQFNKDQDPGDPSVTYTDIPFKGDGYPSHTKQLNISYAGNTISLYVFVEHLIVIDAGPGEIALIRQNLSDGHF